MPEKDLDVISAVQKDRPLGGEATESVAYMVMLLIEEVRLIRNEFDALMRRKPWIEELY